MGWWEPETPVPGRSVFVRPGDREALRVALIDVEQPWPRVFEVGPDTGERLALADVISNAEAFAAALRPDRPDWQGLHRLVRDCDPALQDLLFALVDLLLALRRGDMQMVSYHAKRAAPLIDTTAELSDPARAWTKKTLLFLEHAATTCLFEFGLPALYSHTTADPKYKAWWSFPPSFETTCRQSVQEFDNLLGQKPPAAVLALRAWVNDLKGQVAKLKNPLANGPDVHGFRTASAFFAALSDSWFARDQIVLGLMALHRAAEWLLVALCLTNQLLDFSSKTSVRVLIGPAAVDLTFSGALEALGYASASLFGLEDHLKELNQWRNLCGYTHHLSAPNAAVALPLCNAVRNGLRKLADAQWEKALFIWKQPLPVSIPMLLDPDGSLLEGITELTAEQLSIE